MLSKITRSFTVSLTAFATLALTGCDSNWSGPHKESGPVPLSSSNLPIVRVVDKRTTLEVGDERRLYWDEGKGPVLAENRIKPLLASIPKELNDRIYSTRNVPNNLYPPLRGTPGTTPEAVYDTWGMVVSLNPDVLILSLYETPVGPHNRQPATWNSASTDQARRKYIGGHVEFITGGFEFAVYASTLVPWSTNMYVFSTDPKVNSGRLTFENDRAEILLPAGKLLLVNHDGDITVTRE